MLLWAGLSSPSPLPTRVLGPGASSPRICHTSGSCCLVGSMFGKRSGGKTLKRFAVAVPSRAWASVLSVFAVTAAGWDVEVEALWNLLIFMFFCDVAAWRMAG